VQSVALPLVQEFGYTREIEDRVMAPLPVWAVATQKLVSGALQALLAALVVFPLAAIIPATPVHLSIHWGYLITVSPLAALIGAGLGLTIGTKVEPRQVPLVFSIVIIPITFLGAVYYPWASLEPIRWLQILVLVNPLVYMSEGFRLALTQGVPHMATWAIYTGLIVSAVVLCWLGITGFTKRVLT
jgi:ABC-2 type transport system permease protein